MILRTIIANEKLGIFIGTLSDVPIFSKSDPHGCTKAVSFESEKEAKNFVSTYMSTVRDEVEYIGIPASSVYIPYVDVVDIIKAGYSEQAKEMFESMPPINYTIH